jgi:hypothetical protein
MIGVPAVLTRESMTLTDTAQATARAMLASVARVYPGNFHPVLPCLVDDTVADEPILPERETTAQCSSFDLAPLRSWHLQVLKDQDGIARRPFDKLFGCLLSKGARTVALLAT